MQRISLQPRSNWQAKFEAIGFSFHSIDGCYWDESACYEFSETEIDLLEETTAKLHGLCLEAVDIVISQGRYAELDIPESAMPLIKLSWAEQAPSLYGRFDLAFDGINPPKLLEYNADTPTSIFEAAIAQWHWLEELGKPDQFNSLHEQLIEQWKLIGKRLPLDHKIIFSSVQDSAEDFVTTEYLRDTAMQAGLTTEFCYIEDIGWDGNNFLDLTENPIKSWFKLYPWEWLLQDEFGNYLAQTNLTIIEPAWKMILANKGLLPILWELFPGHPNLLPAYHQPDRLGLSYVSKPLHSREGANITLVNGAQRLATEGPYTGKVIYQQWVELAEFSGNYPIIGSWIIGGFPAGIGIREDNTLITSNASRFVPHFFTPKGNSI